MLKKIKTVISFLEFIFLQVFPFLKTYSCKVKKKKKKLSKPSMKNIEDQLCKYFDVGILVFFFICQKYNLSLYI